MVLGCLHPYHIGVLNMSLILYDLAQNPILNHTLSSTYVNQKDSANPVFFLQKIKKNPQDWVMFFFDKNSIFFSRVRKF